MSLDQRNPTLDIHTIDTPEQIQLDFPLAGIGSRALAHVVDVLVIGTVTFVGFILIFVALFLARRSGHSPIHIDTRTGALWLLAISIALVFALNYGYYALFEILWNGQTPGKRIIGIRVMKESGRPLTATEAIARNLMRIVDQLPSFYAVGFLTALLNSRNQRLGDMVAGAIVVRESTGRNVDHLVMPNFPAVESPLLIPSVSSTKLTPDHLALIEAFFHRRHQLPEDVRRRMAVEILQRLRSAIDLPPEALATPEKPWKPWPRIPAEFAPCGASAGMEETRRFKSPPSHHKSLDRR